MSDLPARIVVTTTKGKKMNLNSPAMIAANERYIRNLAIRSHRLGVEHDAKLRESCPICQGEA